MVASVAARTAATPSMDASSSGSAAAASLGRDLPAVLSAAQRQQYEQDGFTGPVTVLPEAAAADLYRQFLEYEVQLGGKVEGDWRFKVGRRGRFASCCGAGTVCVSRVACV